MSEMVSLTGIVISCIPVAEYDNRIVILTKERGKICAFARGARRLHSALTGLTRPFLMGKFDLYEGRDAYTLTGGESMEYFDELSREVPEVYYGFYFLEIADYYGREGIEAKDMLNLLYVSFKALIDKKIDAELIKIIFEYKSMVLNGEYPQFFECCSCGESEVNYFSVSKGGVLCQKCAATVFDSVKISKDTVYTFQYMTAASIGKLYTFTLTDTIMKEVNMVMTRLKKVNFDKHFKSLDILECMKM